MLGDLQYPMSFGGEVHYPVGFLWKSESELLGVETTPAVKTPETFEEWMGMLDRLCKDTERPAPVAVADALDRALTAMAEAPVPFVDDIVRNLLARLQHESAHVKLKSLNVVIALLDGGVSDEDGEAEQPSLKCISLPNVFSTPAAATSVLREDSERSLMTETGSPRHAKAATAGEAFSLAVRSIMLPMLKQLAEFVTTPHEKWGDRPQQLVRGAARGAIVRAQGRRDEFSIEYQKQRRVPVAANDIVAWVWREKLDHTVDFTVVFVEPHMSPGEEITVVDTKRARKNSGSVVAETAGEVVFMYSNEFSWLNNKIVALATAVWKAGAALEGVILPQAPELPCPAPPEPELEVIDVPPSLGSSSLSSAAAAGGDGGDDGGSSAGSEMVGAPPIGGAGQGAAPASDRSAIAILSAERRKVFAEPEAGDAL